MPLFKKFNFPDLKLVSWYQRNKRDLPWRYQPTPYKTWISEMMLQQTQVSTVIPYFERFIKKFPDFTHLARAKESNVLKLWSGLGYYSRARNLHKAAQEIVQKYKNHLPETENEILKLPGIGPYSAGAILSIAYHQPVPILDGNVRRVFSRFFLENNIETIWKISESSVKTAFQQKCDPADFNQALMELGALICLPKNPNCSNCPIQADCNANKKQVQNIYPSIKKRPKTIQKHYAIFILKNEQKPRFYLIQQRSQNEKWLKGLWEFPMFELNSKEQNELKKNNFKFTAKYFLFQIKNLSFVHSFKHTITRHQLNISILSGTIKKLKTKNIKNSNPKWATLNQIKKESHSSIVKKAISLEFFSRVPHP